MNATTSERELAKARKYVKMILAEDDDERNAAEFDAASAAATLDWANAETIGDTERGAYYDITTRRVPVIGGPVNLRQINDTFAMHAGQDGAAYGSFGGYTTRRAKGIDGLGYVVVECTYHIGD